MRITIPTEITDSFQTLGLGLISDSSGVLRADHLSDRFNFWIKACNPHQNRRALGTYLTGDEVDTLTDQEANVLLQTMLDIFLDRSVEFEEGGPLPEPIRPISI